MNPTNIGDPIYKAIQSQIEKIVREEAVEAGKRVEERVRGDVGAIAAKVLQHFTMERFGPELRITVNFPNTDKPQ